MEKWKQEALDLKNKYQGEISMTGRRKFVTIKGKTMPQRLFVVCQLQATVQALIFAEATSAEGLLVKFRKIGQIMLGE